LKGIFSRARIVDEKDHQNGQQKLKENVNEWMDGQEWDGRRRGKWAEGGRPKGALSPTPD
jgi:hypothetical protein